MNTITELQDKLTEIESRRDITAAEGLFHRFVPEARISTIDQEKIQAIQEFELPNTLDELRDFMKLASENVDLAQYDTSNPIRTVSKKAVSDAWIEKMKQAFAITENIMKEQDANAESSDVEHSVTEGSDPENIQETYKSIRRYFAVTVGKVDHAKNKSHFFTVAFPVIIFVAFLFIWRLLTQLG